jgi:glycosyltransferase involved in cell wall biosynthesis
VVVCSELDRTRLGAPRTAVIPNGYAQPPRPIGRIDVGDPPTVLLAGALTYPPNADAAIYFVEEILPKIHARIPRVRARIVGKHGGGLDHLRSELVSITGGVPDIGAELARADVSVVPLRFGGGTRIKILESFAHRIPVVTTPVGCEGLDSIDGQHLMVADDPESFADACARLLTDVSLRARLTDAAYELYARRYRWEDITQTVVELVHRVSARPAAAPARVPALGSRRSEMER